MKKFETYCTEAQTDKAIKLGAPIDKWFYWYQVENDAIKLPNGELYHATIPTASQMIGWLEAQEEIFEVQVYRASTESKTNNWSFAIFVKQDYDVIIAPQHYFGRKEATLAAIDAALEYLFENKKGGK